eukprot:scaffold1321_cov402-Prasinococcus_capsulatus_cf.AAC.6
MWGPDVGSLYIDIYSAINKQVHESVWSAKGNQGRHWKTAEVRAFGSLATHMHSLREGACLHPVPVSATSSKGWCDAQVPLDKYLRLQTKTVSTKQDTGSRADTAGGADLLQIRVRAMSGMSAAVAVQSATQLRNLLFIGDGEQGDIALDNFSIDELPPTFCTLLSHSKPTPEPSRLMHSGGGDYYTPILPIIQSEGPRRPLDFTYSACQDSIVLFAAQVASAALDRQLTQWDLHTVYRAILSGQTDSIGVACGYRYARKCIEDRIDTDTLNITTKQHSNFDAHIWLVGYDDLVQRREENTQLETPAIVLPGDLDFHGGVNANYLVVPFYRPDVSPPTFIDVDLVEISDEGFTALIATDEECTVSYLVLLESDGQPSVSEVLAPSDLTQRGIQVYARGEVVINAANEYYSQTIPTFRLPGMNLVLHMVAADAAVDEKGEPVPNMTQDVYSVTVDATAVGSDQGSRQGPASSKPMHFTYQPKVSDVTSASFSISLAANQRSTCMVAVYVEESVSPSASDVLTCQGCLFNTSFQVEQGQLTREKLDFDAMGTQVKEDRVDGVYRTKFYLFFACISEASQETTSDDDVIKYKQMVIPAPVSVLWEKTVALVEEFDAHLLLLMALSEQGVIHCLMLTEKVADITCEQIKGKAKEFEAMTVALGTITTRGPEHMVTSLVRHLNYNRKYSFNYCFESERQRLRNETLAGSPKHMEVAVSNGVSPPAFISPTPNILRASETFVLLNVVLSKPATCYVLTVPSGTTVKGNKDVLAAGMRVGEYGRSESINRTIEVDIAEEELPRRINVTNLIPGTEFEIYVTCHERQTAQATRTDYPENDELPSLVPSMMKSPARLSVTTEDRTPPTSVWGPQVTQLNPSRFRVALKMNEPGTIYSILSPGCKGCTNERVDWSFQCEDCSDSADRFSKVIHLDLFPKRECVYIEDLTLFFEAPESDVLVLQAAQGGDDGSSTTSSDVVCAPSMEDGSQAVCWRLLGQKSIEHAGLQRLNLDLGMVLEKNTSTSIRIATRSSFGMAYRDFTPEEWPETDELQIVTSNVKDTDGMPSPALPIGFLHYHSSHQVPSAAEVKRGEGACGKRALDSVELQVGETEGLEGTIGYDHLEPEQEFDVFIALEDDGAPSKPPNLQPSLLHLAVVTPEKKPPAFTNDRPKIANLSETSLEVVVQSSKPETTVSFQLFVSVDPAVAVIHPSKADIIAGVESTRGVPVATGKLRVGKPLRDYTFELASDLQKGQQYDLYMVAEDKYGNVGSRWLHRNMRTQHYSPPVFARGYPMLNNITENTFNISVIMDEPGHVYVAVCDNLLQTRPKSVDVVRNGAGTCDQEKPYNSRGYSKFYVPEADKPATFLVHGSMKRNKKYDVFIVAGDTNSTVSTRPFNIQTRPTKRTVSMTDKTPPVLVKVPTVSDVTGTSFKIEFEMDEDGTFFVCVLETDDSTIEVSNVQVRDMAAASDGSEVTYGFRVAARARQKISAGETFDLTFSDLSPDTGYDVLITAQDNVGNLMVRKFIRYLLHV